MGTTIGNIMISYDVRNFHVEVKRDLVALGYFDYFTFDNGATRYELPNTTLWHHSKSSDQAMSDMIAVTTRLRATLEKAVAVKASEFVGYR